MASFPLPSNGMDWRLEAVCHCWVGAPPILIYFSGDWDVHWGYGALTHGHLPQERTRASKPNPTRQRKTCLHDEMRRVLNPSRVSLESKTRILQLLFFRQAWKLGGRWKTLEVISRFSQRATLPAMDNFRAASGPPPNQASGGQ